MTDFRLPRALTNSVFVLAVALAAILAGGTRAGNEFVFVLLVAFQSLFNNIESGISGKNLLDLNLFTFELLVILKETFQDQQAVAGQIACFQIVAEFRIVDRK